MTYDTINDAVTIPGNGEGTLLANRYRIVRQLGAGGMGSVWLAEDTQLDNKQFAVKMLPSILVSNKRAYRQLKDEALVAMRLVHPNIVQIRAFEENNGNPFLVMDYVDGQTLDEYLAECVDGFSTQRRRAAEAQSGRAGTPRPPRDDGRAGTPHVEEGDVDGRGTRPACPPGVLPEADVLRILKPIAAALDYAHGEGVVHRDVKPANVMIRKDGHPFILDFGIAREIQETMTRVTGKLSSGTLLYMSPEQLMGEQPKPAQDVYSFAAMVYECLKGEPPFVRGAIEDQIKNKIPEPLPGGPRPVAAAIMAGLAKKPEDRPASCAAVLEGDLSTQRREEAEAQNGSAGAPRPPVGSCVPVRRSFSEGGPCDRDDAPQADVSRRRKINCIGSVIVVFVLLGIAAFGFWRWLEELELPSGRIGRGAHDAVHAPAAGHSDGMIAPAAPAAAETRTNDPFRDFDKSFKGDKRDDKIVGGKAVSEIKVLRDLKVIMEPSVPIAGETFHMVFEFACPSDVVLDSVQLKGLPDSGVVYGEASWLPDVPMNGELSFAVPALKSLSQKGPLDSTVVTKQLPAVVKRLLLPVCAMDSMETSVSASLSAMCNWKMGSHTFGTSVEERFPPTSIKVVGKTGYVTGHGAASKKVTAPCTADMVIEEGRTVELIEPCTDDVRVCSGSTLICRGICSGDVEIMKGGRFVCFGVMSGDILNHGGKVEIYGTFTGTRTDL